MTVKKTENNFWKKIEAVKRAYAPQLDNVVKFGHDTLMEEANKNLSGPYYGKDMRGPQTGKMPIPQITTMLRHSMGSAVLSKWKEFTTMIAVFSDKRVASYNAYVHDGTKYQRPRRFLGDAVKARKQAIQNRMKYQILLAIRKEGQK